MSAAAKVGLFMVVVLVILGYFIIRVEDLDLGAGPTRLVDVVFDSVAGLDEKSAVRVAGVRVGKVAKISLLPDGRARVTLEVDEGVQLRQGATARVANLGLLGEKYVELEPGQPGTAPIPENATLPGQTVPSFDDLTAQVSAIADDVKAVTGSMRAALGGPEGAQRLDEIVINIHEVTERLRTILANNEGNVNATAENLRKITDDLRVEIPRIAASIDRVANSLGGTVTENREDVRTLVQNLKTLSADLKTTTENLNDITGQVRSGEGTVGKLLYSDEAHDRLTSTLGSIEGGVGELRNVMGRVNRLGLQVGFDSMFLSDVPNAQFDGNSRFQLYGTLVPNVERNFFLSVAATQDARGDRQEKITETTTSVDGGPPSTVVTHQVKWDDQMLISAQVGWQYDQWKLRAGLIDSYGGFGIDWSGMERVEVTGEAFDFGSDVTDYPQLRLLGRYRIRNEKKNAPAIFLTGGVEDALNDPALLFGAGVRWNEDDLKYLLGSIPIPGN